MDNKIAYGGATNFTLTLASLASSSTAGRESTAIDNSSTKYTDALVQVGVTLQSGTPAADKAVYIYAYGSIDGTNFTDNATGSDAAITLRDPTCLRLIGVIPTPDAGALKYESQPMSVANAFGGILPTKWGIVVRNHSNITLSATEGNHFYIWNGIYVTTS